MDELANTERQPTPGPFQFSLIELFVCVTAAAITVGYLVRWGLNGTLDRLNALMTIGSFLAALLGIHRLIKANLGG